MEIEWQRHVRYMRVLIRDVSVSFSVNRVSEAEIWTGEETFDISADSALWIVANVCDRALVGKHDIIGRAPVCLDPRQFGDFLTHDIWLGLDSAGRILLRISMEGEKDDIQFYFGRAFRSLKRTEGDMGRVFVDKASVPFLLMGRLANRLLKMAPMINQSLSRNVLKVLVKPSGTGVTAVVGNLDYNKALGNMTAFYRNAMGNTAGDVQIPLPPSDKPTRPRGEGGLTDIEIEEPLAPLFNYLTENLRVFDSSLSKTAQEMIINRVWKEILLVLEGLLVPPLSDVPSDLKPLSEREVDIVFKWLKVCVVYFSL